MFQTINQVRVDALTQLLASPQPKDLPRGGHVYRWDGDPDRRSTRLPAIIMSWLQRRYLEIDAEEPLPARARTVARPRRTRPLNPGLHVLSPTGT